MESRFHIWLYNIPNFIILKEISYCSPYTPTEISSKTDAPGQCSLLSGGLLDTWHTVAHSAFALALTFPVNEKTSCSSERLSKVSCCKFRSNWQSERQWDDLKPRAFQASWIGILRLEEGKGQFSLFITNQALFFSFFSLFFFSPSLHLKMIPLFSFQFFHFLFHCNIISLINLFNKYVSSCLAVHWALGIKQWMRQTLSLPSWSAPSCGIHTRIQTVKFGVMIAGIEKCKMLEGHLQDHLTQILGFKEGSTKEVMREVVNALSQDRPRRNTREVCVVVLARELARKSLVAPPARGSVTLSYPCLSPSGRASLRRAWELSHSSGRQAHARL